MQHWCSRLRFVLLAQCKIIEKSVMGDLCFQTRFSIKSSRFSITGSRFSMKGSRFSILDSRRNQESNRESRLATDCQLTFERYCTSDIALLLCPRSREFVFVQVRNWNSKCNLSKIYFPVFNSPNKMEEF